MLFEFLVRVRFILECQVHWLVIRVSHMIIILLVQDNHHTQRVLCAPDQTGTTKLFFNFSTDLLVIPPGRLPRRPWPNQWHSNPTHLGHQTPTTSWSEGSPHKNLKPYCDFATGFGRLAHQVSPPVLRLPFHFAASSWLLASLFSLLALASMSASSRALSVSATQEDSSFSSSNQKRSSASPSEPYSTTSLTSTGAVSLSKAHCLCDLVMRYRMSSWEYQAWSSSLDQKIVLKILNHGVPLLRLFSCDVRLYTTVASLCHFSTHSVLIRRSRARCALVQLRMCRTHHQIFFDTLPSDHTLISVYTSTCQLVYDLTHESASLLFLAARPPFPPEWRLASLQKSVPPLTCSGHNWVSFALSDRSPSSWREGFVHTQRIKGAWPSRHATWRQRWRYPRSDHVLHRCSWLRHGTNLLGRTQLDWWDHNKWCSWAGQPESLFDGSSLIRHLLKRRETPIYVDYTRAQRCTKSTRAERGIDVTDTASWTIHMFGW